MAQLPSPSTPPVPARTPSLTWSTARRAALVLIAFGACTQLSWKGVDAGLIGLAILALVCLRDTIRESAIRGTGRGNALATAALLSPTHLAFTCAVLFSLGYHTIALSAGRETAQLLVLLVVGGKVGSLLVDDDLSGLARALTIALCLSVAVALCQLTWPAGGQSLLARMYGPPYAAGGTGPALVEEIATGLLPSQCLYATFVVISFPFVLAALGASSSTALLICGMTVLALAAQTTIAGTALLGLAGAAILTFALGPSRWRLAPSWLSAALIIVLAALGGSRFFGPDGAPSPWESMQPFVPTESGEMVLKRSSIEAAAVIAETPGHVAGWGAGTYQTSVSKARVRAQLPPPRQDRVKRDSTSQYLALTLEYGPVAAILMLILFVGSAARGAEHQFGWPRRARSGPDAATIAAAAAVAWMACSGLLFVRGPGPLIGLIIGAAARRPRPVPVRPFLRLTGQAFLIAVAVAAGMFLRPAVHTVIHQSGKVGHRDIIIEAEHCLDRPEGFVIRPANHTGGHQVLTIPEGTGKGSGAVSYRVAVPASGSYKLWIRANWEDACGNSVHCRLQGGPLVTVEDAIFGRWHWVDIAPNHVFELQQGEAELILQNAEDGVHIDQIALFADRNAMPVGILGSTDTPVDLADEPGEALPASPPPALDLEAEDGPVEDAFDKYAE
ncbi:MAG: hypothetical protein HN742_38445 [Lentisphaerae bacterium]|jgi:hypothetical protein|nr:hypothetical protein [Lentisphaerota bacterium]MBT4816473.1 hypothetical protein [Lentisphaerota bacterium]MBT5609281.1 hypothetical protein [Lentisphaerota bacterium]MBT7059425.1 hypothetical protein [Lentisphaerota bacterium]MBT7847809.1 hypothetical protein [Lentisphaerota bacterium]